MKIINSNVFNIILNRHFRFWFGLVSAFGFFLIQDANSFIIEILISWLTFIFIYLTFSWIVIFTYHPSEVKIHAKEEDNSSTYIFLFIVFAALFSLAGIIILLQSNLHSTSLSFKHTMILTLTTVFGSWLLVHTIFLLRYAHLYYYNLLDKNKKVNTPCIVFPGDLPPDYLDFAYFSFVIGMTFQVSDISITTGKMRRLALLHSILSFFFNTIILALSINIVSGIISK